MANLFPGIVTIMNELSTKLFVHCIHFSLPHLRLNTTGLNIKCKSKGNIQLLKFIKIFNIGNIEWF